MKQKFMESFNGPPRNVSGLTFTLYSIGSVNNPHLIRIPVPAGIYKFVIHAVDTAGNENAALADVEVAGQGILWYYRALGNNPNVVETTDLLKAADDWSNNIAPQGFTSPITTQQLLALADEWSGS
jgi:hypothetical protein